MLNTRLVFGVFLTSILLLQNTSSGFAQTDCAPPVSGEGVASFYTYLGNGACSLGASEEMPMVAAMNDVDYDGSNICGQWLRVTGPLGSVNVQVVDKMPGGLAGDLDLNEPAFEAIALLTEGFAPVTWETIEDPTVENIDIYIDHSSSIWWASISVRNPKYGIAAVEYLSPGGYVPAPRALHNFFTLEQALAPFNNPFTIRLTDVHGQTVVVENIPLNGGTSFSSSVQLPTCTSVSGVPTISTRKNIRNFKAAPNPFNPSTELSFELETGGQVLLEIYDLQGRNIRSFGHEYFERGTHRVRWDGKSDAGQTVGAGLYLSRIRIGRDEEVQRLLLVK